MADNKITEKNGIEIDIIQLLKAVWAKIWLVALVGILCAAIGFGYAAYFITPTYSSSVMLYVNNRSLSLGSLSVNGADLSISEKLVPTFSALLKNRTTLKMVKEHGNLPYSVGELSGMISASSVEDTSILKITVTTSNPDRAAEVANCIAEVLPQRVGEIVEGSSTIVVDSAIPNRSKLGPNTSRYAAIGFGGGAIAMALLLMIIAMTDNRIHDEEYVMQNYTFPVLAKVPNLMESDAKTYDYYYQSKKSTSDTKKGGDK